MARRKRIAKIGVIGTGMGRYHMAGFAKNKRAKLLAVCDLNEKEARAFAKQYGARYVFTDYRDMCSMKELDALSIAVPNYLHAPMTLFALEHGKHVLCEKPLTFDAAGAVKLVRAARRAGRRLMVNMSLRWYPTAYMIKQLVDRGELGRVYFAKVNIIRRHAVPQLDFGPDGSMGRGSWFLDKSKAGGGVLMDLGVHAFDMCRHLLGLPRVKSVTGKTFAAVGPARCAAAGIKNNVDDMAVGFVTFIGGAACKFEVTWDCHQRSDTSIRVYGTKAGAEMAGGRLTLFKDSAGKAVEREIKIPKKIPQSYDHFVDAILDAKLPLEASADEAVVVMKVLDALRGK